MRSNRGVSAVMEDMRSSSGVSVVMFLLSYRSLAIYYVYNYVRISKA